MYECNCENEIMDNLLLDIREGKYISDDRLPSDNELAQKYNVSRMRVRKVYEKLEQMGYIYSLQGRGRFLKKRGYSIELVLSGNESFTEKLENAGYTLVTKNIFCYRIPYNKEIFNELKVERNIPVYKIGRLRIVDKEPLAMHISYVPKDLFSNVSLDGKNIKSMFDYYKLNGYKNYMTEKTSLEISYSTSEERRFLNCRELVPLLKVKTNCKDTDINRILEYTEIIYRGDKFIYKI